MRRIFKFSFSLVAALMVCSNIHGQDTIMRIRGLRLGVDLSRLALQYVEPGRSGYCFSADFEAFKNFYPTVQYGWQTLSFKKSKPNYQYNSEGKYWRVGFEYNALKKIKYSQYEMVFIGVNYGFSKFTQKADSAYIYDSHWGGNYASVPTIDHRADWAELTAGVRAELFKNFFIGWSFSGRMLLWHTRHSPLVPYESPGFGTIQLKTSLGFNYSIYYRIPLFKVKYINNKKADKNE